MCSVAAHKNAACLSFVQQTCVSHNIRVQADALLGKLFHLFDMMSACGSVRIPICFCCSIKDNIDVIVSDFVTLYIGVSSKVFIHLHGCSPSCFFFLSSASMISSLSLWYMACFFCCLHKLDIYSRKGLCRLRVQPKLRLTNHLL